MKSKYEFESPEELQRKVDEYFCLLQPQKIYGENDEAIVDKNGVPILSDKKPATISALALHCGFYDKREFLKLRNSRMFAKILRRAILRIQAYTEELLFDKSTSAGAKFLLQTDFGLGGDLQGEENDKNVQKAVVVLAALMDEENS